MKTIVIKVGTSSICSEKTHLPRLSTISLIVESIHRLRQAGYRVVLVTSAAIGMGRRTVNVTKSKLNLSEKQALAAIGQGKLMSLYDSLFSLVDQPIAQVLLTRHDIAERSKYLNAKNTLMELLAMNVVPIINENDTVSVSEIRFGDNDTLSAITAAMVKADWLFLLTDVECLYTDNPRNDPDAKPILEVDDIQTLMETVSVKSSGSSLGTGGMVTKLIAANLATAAGIPTIITSSQYPDKIQWIVENLAASLTERSVKFTHFLPKPNPMLDRKWWILHGLKPSGILVIDSGAVRAVSDQSQNASLFAAGIVTVIGDFNAQECVDIRSSAASTENVAQEHVLIGRGIANYSSTEIERIKGKQSQTISEILGYSDTECVIHRDNLVIIRQ